MTLPFYIVFILWSVFSPRAALQKPTLYSEDAADVVFRQVLWWESLGLLGSLDELAIESAASILQSDCLTRLDW